MSAVGEVGSIRLEVSGSFFCYMHKMDENKNISRMFSKA